MKHSNKNIHLSAANYLLAILFVILAAVPASAMEKTGLYESEPRLTILSPVASSTTVTNPSFTFTGTCDRDAPLSVNGTLVIPHEDGSFSYSVILSEGKNQFLFSHKTDTLIYTVNYENILIKNYAPSGKKTYAAGAVFTVSVTAKTGSKVKASFQGKTVSLIADSSAKKDGYVCYKGAFAMPSGDPNKTVDLGKITYTVSLGGKTERVFSGVITCKKAGSMKKSDFKATPTGGKYQNVGSGYIAEIVCHSAETFDGKAPKNDSIDWSRPTNNYLPQGTVDYCSTSLIPFEEKKYATLRAGYRVYTDKLNTPLKPKVKVIKRYAGTLPDHNELRVLSYRRDDAHMVLTVDCLWKAPFYFKLAPQDYQNAKTQDYRVTSLTCDHIDITFCYATSFKGLDSKNPLLIAKDDPLFKSAKLIKNKSDYTLRLTLKKKGGFYGWDASYNKNGELCFTFLMPRTIKKAKNDYGVNLNGAVIFLDVGHGGVDIGAAGLQPKKHNEAIQNLVLAKKIKTELKKIGATVVMNRTDNSTTCSSNQKQILFRQTKPDYCLSIHHDSSVSTGMNGFCAYYFLPFSQKAATYIRKETVSTGKQLYKKIEPLKFHTYYLLRCTACPVVLTENGYISNRYDFNNIISAKQNTLKAKALTRGIVDYFKSIQ